MTGKKPDDIEKVLVGLVRDAVLCLIEGDLLITQKAKVEAALRKYSSIRVARWGWAVPCSIAITMLLALRNAGDLEPFLTLSSGEWRGVFLVLLILFVGITLGCWVIALINIKCTANSIIEGLSIKRDK